QQCTVHQVRGQHLHDRRQHKSQLRSVERLHRPRRPSVGGGAAASFAVGLHGGWGAALARPTPSRRYEAVTGVFTTCPVACTNQRSLAIGLPARRATSQSATSTGGNGPRLAAGTLPTECRLSA